MKLLLHIFSSICALLLSVLSAVASTTIPAESYLAEFTPHQHLSASEQIDIPFAARPPPLTGPNVAFTYAPVAEHGAGVATHRNETHLAGLGFDVGFGAPNRGGITNPLVDPSTNLASAQRTQHILYGDATGGGHLWPGGAGKTAFPKSWDANKVMYTISDIATDPKLSWKAQTGNGGYTQSQANQRALSLPILAEICRK